MRSRFALLALVLAAWLLAGCDGQPTRIESVAVVEQRPELMVYEAEGGNSSVAFVWGHGPVNLNCLLVAHCPAHPNGVIGKRMNCGASFAGAATRTPLPGDVIAGSLLPGPIADSLGAVVGGFTLTCTLPDTLEGLAWAFVPSGPCGPDTLKNWVRLIRVP